MTLWMPPEPPALDAQTPVRKRDLRLHLKTPLPDGSGEEWETPCDDIGLAAKELCKLGAPEDLLPLTASGLTEACSARFTRLAKQIVLERCTVELALDEGTLMGGGKTLPFAEVEEN